MTMVAAIHSRGGGLILAADCCVSIRFHGDPQMVHRDEVQKVHALSRRLAVAYSTDDVAAVHRLLRAIPEIENQIESALAGTPDELADLLSTLADTKAPDATILLAVLAAPDGRSPYVATWDSRAPYGAKVIDPGSARVLGSGSAIKEVVDVSDQCAKIEHPASVVSSVFANRYANLYHANHKNWSELGVGGLLHFCVLADDGSVKYSETEQAARYSALGHEYSVSMRYGDDGKWRQRRTDGREIEVINGLNQCFQPVNADHLLLT